MAKEITIVQDIKFGNVRIIKNDSGDEAIELIQYKDGKHHILIQAEFAIEIATFLAPKLKDTVSAALDVAEELNSMTDVLLDRDEQIQWLNDKIEFAVLAMEDVFYNASDAYKKTLQAAIDKLKDDTKPGQSYVRG